MVNLEDMVELGLSSVLHDKGEEGATKVRVKGVHLSLLEALKASLGLTNDLLVQPTAGGGNHKLGGRRKKKRCEIGGET